MYITTFHGLAPINVNNSALTLSLAMAVVDASGHDIDGLTWIADASMRAAMIYCTLDCRTTDKDDESIHTETVKMLENGEWKDSFRFLGIPVKVDSAIPAGTVRLLDSDSVLGEINNVAVPKFYHGH